MTSDSTTDLTPGRDLAGYLTRYPHQVNVGVRLDRDRLLAHMRTGRKNATGVHVVVHETVIDGDRVAARYTLTATMRKGSEIVTEIYMFGHLAPDGRLHHVDQVTRNLPTADT